MGNLWQRIKRWTVGVVTVVVTLFLIILISRNWNAEVSPSLDLVFKNYPKAPFLLVTLITGVTSILGWWLIRTLIKMIWQLRQARERRRTERLEREVADMKAKAAMLQTRSEKSSGPPAAPSEGD